MCRCVYIIIELMCVLFDCAHMQTGKQTDTDTLTHTHMYVHTRTHTLYLLIVLPALFSTAVLLSFQHKAVQDWHRLYSVECTEHVEWPIALQCVKAHL